MMCINLEQKIECMWKARIIEGYLGKHPVASLLNSSDRSLLRRIFYCLPAHQEREFVIMATVLMNYCSQQLSRKDSAEVAIAKIANKALGLLFERKD